MNLNVYLKSDFILMTYGYTLTKNTPAYFELPYSIPHYCWWHCWDPPADVYCYTSAQLKVTDKRAHDTITFIWNYFLFYSATLTPSSPLHKQKKVLTLLAHSSNDAEEGVEARLGPALHDRAGRQHERAEHAGSARAAPDAGRHRRQEAVLVVAHAFVRDQVEELWSGWMNK